MSRPRPSRWEEEDEGSAAAAVMPRSQPSTPRRGTPRTGRLPKKKSPPTSTASSSRRRDESEVGEFYRKGLVIGRGSTGVVYEGMDTRTGMLVAIKEVAAQVGDETFRGLVQEVQLMSRLRHDHIVEYYGADFDEARSVLYIIQEWVPGGSIDSLLDKFGGTFADDVTHRYALDVARGLEYLHGKGIVHRDIKGGNVLVSDQGVAKLSDFGTSMMLADNTTNAGAKTLCGTPYFMAPEVLKGDQRYGRKADIWSFGGLLLQMATGSPPWKCLNFHNITQLMVQVSSCGEPPPLEDYDLSPSLKRVMLRCFEIDPTRRPTAAELLEDPFLKRAPDVPLDPPPPPLSPPPPARSALPRRDNPYSRSAARSRTASASQSPRNHWAASSTTRSQPAFARRQGSSGDEYRDTPSARPRLPEAEARSADSAGLRRPQRSAISPLRNKPKHPEAVARREPSEEEDAAFDALVRTLADDPDQEPDDPPPPRRSPRSPYATTPRNKVLPPPKADDDDGDEVDRRRPLRASETSEVGATPPGTNDIENYASAIPWVDQDDDQRMTIEQALEQHYITERDYNVRLDRVKRGDEDAGYYSAVNSVSAVSVVMSR